MGKIVAYSAHFHQEWKTRAEALGCDYYLTKPCSARDIQRAAAGALKDVHVQPQKPLQDLPVPGDGTETRLP
jgi:CheY-like chemotaxis protein